MNDCWCCGRVAHAPWCSDGTPNDCTHCGGNPCRWWCLGEDSEYTRALGPGLWDGLGRNSMPWILEPA